MNTMHKKWNYIQTEELGQRYIDNMEVSSEDELGNQADERRYRNREHVFFVLEA